VTRDRVVLALASGFVAAAAMYAVLRVAQAVLMPEGNPGLMAPSLHSGYFWRGWIAAYGGGFVALVVGLVFRSPDRVALHTTRALPYVCALLIAQALFLP
jgi:hypothetical protein